jgi:hypothetical protein
MSKSERLRERYLMKQKNRQEMMMARTSALSTLKLNMIATEAYNDKEDMQQQSMSRLKKKSLMELQGNKTLTRNQGR